MAGMAAIVARDHALYPAHMPHVSLALVGFGSVGRAFAHQLLAMRARLLARYELEWSICGIATGRHGMAINKLGLDLGRILGDGPDAMLEAYHCCPNVQDTVAFIRAAEPDVLIETTVLDIETGGAAVEHIRTALESGAHVVTANKGPVACAYRELRDLATQHGRSFRFEGTVMDGTPVFNLVDHTLPGCEVRGFRAVLNSTTNFALTAMEEGATFDEALADARARGIVEADADHDIDRLDAAAKTAALINVLMGGQVAPRDVPTTGIRRVSRADLDEARSTGRRIRLVASAERGPGGIVARVGLESLSEDDQLARLRGTSNAIVLRTDLMGDLTIVEHDPGVEQTAYALLADLIAIACPPSG